MRVPFSFASAVRLLLALMVIVGSAVLLSSSSDTPDFTASDKAYYADASTVNFVRPGLVLKIASASIADDGTVKVRVKMTDPKGLGLDKDGVTTPGSISTRFVIGYIPAGKTQYTSYIVRNVASSISGKSATQATSDSTGAWEKLADGDYNYTFAAKVPAGFDKTVTHTIGLWGARDLSEFELDGNANYSSTTFNFVPNGSAVKVTRDVVRTQSCNRCHDPLQAHDERRGVELCIICHQPQTIDPDTGNTLDMAVFIHKLHTGADLPSVKAGKPYQIIGYRNAVADYSTVAFPADVRRCTVCHEQNTGAAQADAYLKPNQDACGSCHDTVNFATGEGHVDLPQISNNQCAGCHKPEGELEFDASIKGAHVIATESRDLPGAVFGISDVIDGVAGKRPTVAFTVKDKAGNPFDISKMRLQIVLAGPTSDYASYVSEDVTKAQGPGDGTYFWTFSKPLAADAKGTYAVGIEGYRSVTLQPGTKKEQANVRDAGINVVKYFSVDGSKLQPRRQVVSLDKCNSCHAFLSLHGGNRNQIEQCVLCHNPNTTDSGVRPKDKGAAQSISLANMVHRIHTGEEGGGDYIIYGRGGSVNNFGEVRYPGDRRDCNQCHVNGSEQPPLPAVLDVQNPAGLLNPMGPITAACTGCHTSVATASHALSNTTEQLGEACAACHSTGYEFGIPKMHAR